MNVSHVDKLTILTDLFGTILDRLGEKAVNHDLSADDLVDFFAIGIGAVVENDSNLNTPQKRRLAAEAATRRISEAVKALGEYREMYGQSYLSAVINGPEDQGLKS